MAKPPMSNARRKKLLISYLPDWILTIALGVVFYMLDKVEGYRREFSLTDTSLRHPYAVHERVPAMYLYIIAVLIPLVIMPVINVVSVRSWWDFHNSTLGLVLGFALTGSFTQVVKITVGRPRPDIISRCAPPAGLVDPPYGLTNSTVCTQTNSEILRDGFRSFFSGHSSLSFAGLGFLSFYLAGKMHLFDKQGHAGKAWLSLLPFMGALLVAISRTMDYRHHWQDVLVGSAVGTIFAYFAYRQYYPSLESPTCHRPFSPRIERETDQNVLPTHMVGYSSDQGHDDPGGDESTNLTQDYEMEVTVAKPGYMSTQGESETNTLDKLPVMPAASVNQPHRQY